MTTPITTPVNPENIEKTRQAIMRFNELLMIMRQKLEAGERAYKQLFANCTPEQMASMKEKDLQTLVAQQIVNDLTPLSNAVLQAQLNARSVERDFEELYNIILTPVVEDE